MAKRSETQVDLFEAAYRAGVAEEVAPPVGPEGGRELLVRAAPAEAVALHGCVLTPSRAIEKGYVVVEGSEIQSVGDNRPQGVRMHETHGVITPGLIDLHGHPEFNIFAAWEPPKQFVNRYAWRDSPIYHDLVRDPQNHLLKVLPAKTQLRYAEIRALVGGVTAIQGTGGQAASYQAEALVRNVDKWIFGGQVGRAMIDLPSGIRGADDLKSILGGIADGKVKAFYVHLAEGQADNERSQDEFKQLVELKALTPSTVVIHGTALTRDQLGDLGDGGAKLVWSPQSNLRLYGQTTRAEDALDLGLPLALGADWLPSGSTSLLAEIKVAQRTIFEQRDGRPPTSRQLVDMVTREAARIAGLDDKLGLLKVGRPADLVVFERRVHDPWENIVEAEPAWINLVMIGGDLAYGRKDWITELVAKEDQGRLEALLAWGKPKLLDTSYMAGDSGEQQPQLAQLRADLVKEYPPLGPIFA